VPDASEIEREEPPRKKRCTGEDSIERQSPPHPSSSSSAPILRNEDVDRNGLRTSDAELAYDIDEALALAQEMEPSKRKFRGRCSGGDRKKRKRVETADERKNLADDRRKRTVYINNLSFKSTTEDLQFLTKCGEIESTRLGINKATGKLNGSAHIVFTTLEGAQSAVDLHGVDDEVDENDETNEFNVRGRRIVIEPSESKSWYMLLPSTLANRVGAYRKSQFRLPRKMENDLVRLFIEKKYEMLVQNIFLETAQIGNFIKKCVCAPTDAVTWESPILIWNFLRFRQKCVCAHQLTR